MRPNEKRAGAVGQRSGLLAFLHDRIAHGRAPHAVAITKNVFPLMLPPFQVDYSQDFFGQSVSLTVSGQLEAEA